MQVKWLFAVCGLALSACSGEEQAGGPEQTARAELPSGPLEIGALKQNPCGIEAVKIGRFVFPEAGSKLRVDAKPRDSNCYLTINGGMDADKKFRIAQVALIFDGVAQGKYTEYTEFMGEKPAEGFEVPTNFGTVHKPGEEYAYTAYPKQGSYTVVLKARDMPQKQADEIARELSRNLSVRLN